MHKLTKLPTSPITPQMRNWKTKGCPQVSIIVSLIEELFNEFNNVPNLSEFNNIPKVNSSLKCKGHEKSAN